VFSLPQYNVDAAPADEKSELLIAGPWCFADDLGDTTLECDGRAQRTQRAGVYEMKHWLRNDRHFCESKFFRTRVTPTEPAIFSTEACRELIAERNTTCYKECGMLLHLPYTHIGILTTAVLLVLYHRRLRRILHVWWRQGRRRRHCVLG
jgi:hypothetical protein